MAFWGQYGNLSTVQAAIQMLKDISQEITPEDLSAWNDLNAPNEKKYRALRYVREIEGLQRVVWLNGGCPAVNWLPVFFDHTKERW